MLLDLSCLSYPLPPDVRRLYEAGDFDRMELVIRRRLDDPCVPEALKARLRVQLDPIHLYHEFCSLPRVVMVVTLST